MSLRLDCLAGLFKPGLNAPPLPLLFAGNPLGFFIERASRLLETPGIVMQMPVAYSPTSVRPLSTPTDLLSLQLSLAAMLRNQIGTKVSRVGVLYADRMVGHPSLFGLMFDLGFPEPNLPGAFTSVAREGCAVFLDAIAAQRPDPAQALLETLFTTGHELSHLFNLWHVSTLSFMARSNVSVPPFGPAAYGYALEHVRFLSQMNAPEVFPGGTPFGVRGRLGPTDPDPTNEPTSNRVTLRLSLTRQECWPFEPIELDIRVTPGTRGTDRKKVTLPDMFDPGYEAFDLWINEPDGARRRYRSPALYCDNPGTIDLSHARPFERDIPIFGQSGGYTFHKVGIHRITATFRLPDGGVVRSNDAEVLVKPARPESAQYRRLREALTHRSTAQLLFYKSASSSQRAAKTAMARVKSVSDRFAKEATRYAAGMAMLKGRSAAHVRHDRLQLGLSSLKSAVDSGLLGRHREDKASACIEQWNDHLPKRHRRDRKR